MMNKNLVGGLAKTFLTIIMFVSLIRIPFMANLLNNYFYYTLIISGILWFYIDSWIKKL